MSAPRWRFARMTPAEINQDPVQGEFFSRETDLPGRVVREAIQNSIDARRRNQQVRVRFVFSGETGRDFGGSRGTLPEAAEEARQGRRGRRWLAGQPRRRRRTERRFGRTGLLRAADDVSRHRGLRHQGADGRPLRQLGA